MLLPLLLLLGAARAMSPWPDEPYVEVVSFRLQQSSKTQPFNTVPFTNASTVRSALVSQSQVWLARSTDSQWYAGIVRWGTSQVVGPTPTNSWTPLGFSTFNHAVLSPANGELVAFANGSHVSHVQCNVSGTSVHCSTAWMLQWTASPTDLAAAAFWPQLTSSAAQGWLLLGTSSGAFAALVTSWEASPSELAVVQLVSNESVRALAIDTSQPDQPVAVMGSNQRFYRFVRGGVWPALDRWYWVTDLATTAGGTFDGPIADLAFDACGSVWATTPTAINVMHANGTVTRAAGVQGLAWNETTVVRVPSGWALTGSPPTAMAGGRGFSITVQPVVQGAKQGRAFSLGSSAFIGTTRGVLHWMPWALDDDPGAFSGSTRACAADVWPPRPGTFRYLANQRWTGGGDLVLSLDAAVVPASDGSLQDALFVSAATASSATVESQGAVLTLQPWTLLKKAQYYTASVLPRHDRSLGYTADCSLSSPGNLSSIHCTPSESDGIWTSLTLVAEAAQAALSGQPADLTTALRRTDAIQALFQVTGIPGYPARALSPPSDPVVGGNWFNSTTMPGYTWQGSTSADSFTGDVTGLTAAMRWLSPLGADTSAPASLLLQSVDQVIRNGYYLIGETGTPTKWGRWNPYWINTVRSWSDQRGLNSLQMLSYLSCADAAASLVSGSSTTLLQQAWAELTNSTNQYDRNVMTEEIEAPDDDNYSDLELAFLPFFNWLGAPTGVAQSSSIPPSPLTARTGVQRSWAHIRELRLSLWNVIFLSAALAPNTTCSQPAQGTLRCAVSAEIADLAMGYSISQTMRDTAWNLRTWPLELVTWNTDNSFRRDIDVFSSTDRDGHFGTQSVRVLPANERSQYRWNANPRQISPDGNNGLTEFEPGAYLAPYWVARLVGLLE
jgi:hypothetical protein